MNEINHQIEQQQLIEAARERDRQLDARRKRELELEDEIRNMWNFDRRRQADLRMMDMQDFSNAMLRTVGDAAWMIGRALGAIHNLYELRCLRRQQAPTVSMVPSVTPLEKALPQIKPPEDDSPSCAAATIKPKSPLSPSVALSIPIEHPRYEITEAISRYVPGHKFEVAKEVFAMKL